MATTLSFTVRVSVAETTFAGVDELAASVNAGLAAAESDPATLVDKIKEAASPGSDTSNWDAVTGLVAQDVQRVTRSPTTAPTAANEANRGARGWTWRTVATVVGSVVVAGTSTAGW